MFSTRVKGFGGITTLFIGLMVTVIIAVSVVIPVVQETIENANLTGAAGTLLAIVPLLVVVAIVLLVVGLYRIR